MARKPARQGLSVRGRTSLPLWLPPSLGTAAEIAANRREYQHAWRDWIRQQPVRWSWLGHFTTRRRGLNFEVLDRHWIEYARKVEAESLSGATRRKRYALPWVRTLEWQSDGTGHVHALLAMCDQFGRARMEALWTHGDALVEPYDPTRAGIEYILLDIDRDAHVWPSPFFGMHSPSTLRAR